MRLIEKLGQDLVLLVIRINLAVRWTAIPSYLDVNIVALTMTG